MPRTNRRLVPLLAALLIAGMALILHAMGRTPICTCGEIDLFVGGKTSPRLSQMIADWYAPSHIAHGLIFYAALHALRPRWPVGWRLIVAMLIEAAWEVAENTPMVIDRYREATVAIGYTGDSILNSVADMAMMLIGFWLARRLPVWASLLLLVGLEVAALIAIRDNLTLNVWMLVAPNDAIRAWQAGG